MPSSQLEIKFSTRPHKIWVRTSPPAQQPHVAKSEKPRITTATEGAPSFDERGEERDVLTYDGTTCEGPSATSAMWTRSSGFFDASRGRDVSQRGWAIHECLAMRFGARQGREPWKLGKACSNKGGRGQVWGGEYEGRSWTRQGDMLCDLFFFFFFFLKHFTLIKVYIEYTQ